MDKNTATKELLEALKGYPSVSWNEAKASKNLPRIKNAIAAGADWTTPTGSAGYDIPFSAAGRFDEKPLELLLDAGVPVDHTRNGDTLLHWAAQFGRTNVIEMLVKRGAPVTARNSKGKTPLDVARSSPFGKEAVPLLTELTRAARQASPKKPVAVEGADLTEEAMIAAVAALPKRSLKPEIRSELEQHVKAAFLAGPAIRVDQFLRDLADTEDMVLLAAGMLAATKATTRAPESVEQDGAENVVRVHVGDLTVKGDCDANSLVVTGNLTVKGRLTNWEGRQICVGGTLIAKTVVNEGPMWVGGELHATKGMFSFGNDYGTIVKGALITPVLIQEDHPIKAKEVRAEQRYRKPSAIPKEDRARLARMLKVRLFD